jgi:hypothetical protein
VPVAGLWCKTALIASALISVSFLYDLVRGRIYPSHRLLVSVCQGAFYFRACR